MAVGVQAGGTPEKVMEWLLALSDEEMQAALEWGFVQLQPTLCCIVADMFQGWVQDVANTFHVPRVHHGCQGPRLRPQGKVEVPELLERGELPFTAAGAMKKDILLPGMAPIPAEDVWPSFAYGAHAYHKKFVRTFLRLNESSITIVNTFEELEAETFKVLRTDFVAANIKVPGILPILLSDIQRMQGNGSQTSNRKNQVPRWNNGWTLKPLTRSFMYVLVVL